MKRPWVSHPAVWALTALSLALLGGVALTAQAREAAPPAQTLTTAPSNPALSNSDCLACHGTPGMSKELSNGETLSLTIDQQKFDLSVHAAARLGCTDCHTDITTFPHPEFAARDRRDVTLQLYTNCRKCHEDKYQLTLDSTHARALAGGNTNAAVCVDCHGAHDVQRVTTTDTHEVLLQAHFRIPQTCARCHNAIFEQYQNSVHGAALLEDANPDVPTCIDCHGVHNITDPTTAAFRLQSPQLCAKCHTDAARMSKYGLSTQVLNTYVADFHGTTVTLFQKQSPDQPTNKPVCFDCHGIHNITRVDDPQLGLEVKANLLRTCQKCHPDATINFPDAWFSHYISSAEKNPLVYYVDLFYQFFIPTMIGGMLIFIVSDMVRRFINRRQGAVQP